jgi:anti-anti-sigma regulatory factor
MLRITIHDDPKVLTFKLEGSLAGPWLSELEECWQDALACRGSRPLRVDLTGVTFISTAGKTCLAAMYRQGAELVAADCLTKDIVDEVIQSSAGSTITQSRDEFVRGSVKASDETA